MLCRNCGNSLYQTEAFCVNCGAKAADAPYATDEMIRPEKVFDRWFMWLTVFLAIMALSIFLYLHFTEEGPEAADVIVDVDEIPSPVSYYEPHQADEPAVLLTGPEVFERNVYSVFTIYVNAGLEYVPNGSGFFITPTGVAVTNHHVMAGWLGAAIYTHDGERFEITGFFSYDINNDLAIIQVNGRGRVFQYVTISSLDDLRVGEDVFAIGSPRGIYRNTFTAGILSRMADEAIEVDIYRLYNVLQFTAPITGGNSGGPLFNNRGEVIGVNTAAYGAYAAQNINFAVRIDRINKPVYGEAELRLLPIGDFYPTLEKHGFIVGVWTWPEGYYVFYEDGTGRRDWMVAPGSFAWRIVGNVLEIRQPGRERETWALRVLDDYRINIGGAAFEWLGEAGEVELPERYLGDDDLIAEAIIGAWVWDGGLYIFDYDGTGWRDWADSFGYFDWSMYGGRVHTQGHDNQEGVWVVNILDDYNITIAGLDFARWLIPEPDVVDFLWGEWMWDDGYYFFMADGTGWHWWLLYDEYTFFVWYAYPELDELVLFNREFDVLVLEMQVIYDDHIIVNGYDLWRME